MAQHNRDVDIYFPRAAQVAIRPPYLDSWDQVEIRQFLRRYKEYEKAVEVRGVGLSRAMKERPVPIQFLLSESMVYQVEADLKMEGREFDMENVISYLREGTVDEQTEILELEKLWKALDRLKMELTRTGEVKHVANGRRLISRVYQLCAQHGFPELHQEESQALIKKFTNAVQPEGLRLRLETWRKRMGKPEWAEFLRYFKERLAELDRSEPMRATREARSREKMIENLGKPAGFHYRKVEKALAFGRSASADGQSKRSDAHRSGPRSGFAKGPGTEWRSREGVSPRPKEGIQQVAGMRFNARRLRAQAEQDKLPAKMINLLREFEDGIESLGEPVEEPCDETGSTEDVQDQEDACVDAEVEVHHLEDLILDKVEEKDSSINAVEYGEQRSTRLTGFVNGIATKLGLDTGCDYRAVISRKLAERLKKLVNIEESILEQPEKFRGWTSRQLEYATSKMHVVFTIPVKDGWVTWSNVPALITEGTQDLVLIGQPLLEDIGLDIRSLLNKVGKDFRCTQTSVRCHQRGNVDTGVNAIASLSGYTDEMRRQHHERVWTVPGDAHNQSIARPPSVPEALSVSQSVQNQVTPDGPETDEVTPAVTIGQNSAPEVQELLEAEIQRCSDAGLGKNAVGELRELCHQYQDIFRTQLGFDPPAAVPPMEVKMKPDTPSLHAKPRRYGPEKLKFMETFVDDLQALGLLYKCPDSRFSSAAHIVTKPNGEFRVTGDYRRLNMHTLLRQSVMPHMDVMLMHLQGATVFFSLDFFKGFWQLPLHPDSQELLAVLFPNGIFAPTRVPQGHADAAGFFQSTMLHVFEDIYLKGVVCWLDDLLGYAPTTRKLLDLLRRVFQICEERGLKLNPRKCEFFRQQLRWCGKLLSADGISADPKKVETLHRL